MSGPRESEQREVLRLGLLVRWVTHQSRQSRQSLPWGPTLANYGETTPASSVSPKTANSGSSDRCFPVFMSVMLSDGDPMEPPAETDQRGGGAEDVTDPDQQATPAAQRPGACQMPD